MHRNPTPHTWMHRNRHSSGKCTRILPLTHECTEIVTPQINTPESWRSQMNATKSSLLRKMHKNSTPHTWMHRNHHPSSTCTGILPLTHECIEIVTHQVNAPKSYPSHMNAPNSSSLRWMHQNLTPHTCMHRNCHSSGKCTKIVTLTHESTEIMIHQVNATEPYPSHMNAPKSSLLKLIHRNPTPHTWMNRIHHPSSKFTGILPLTHECTKIVTPQVNAPESYPSHMNAPKLTSLK